MVIGERPPARLDKALSLYVPEEAALSRTRIARLMAQGAVQRRVGTAREDIRDPAATPGAGEIYEIALPDPAPAGVAPEAIPLSVVHEDAELIVIDKPAGMVVHPAPGSPAGTLVNALLHHCGAALSGIGGVRRPGIVHRIDKDTSGLLVVAKSDAAHLGLAAQFARHSVEREYLACVHGVPDRSDPRLAGIPGVGFEAGGVVRIATGIDRHRNDRQRMAVTRSGGRHAVTRFEIGERFGPGLGSAALLSCRLETGRTHQIRVHLSHVGHPLIGDPVYGGRRRLPRAGGDEATLAAIDAFPRQALHAATLGFVHPVSGETLRFSAAPPQDMASLIAALRRLGAGEASPGR